MRSVRDIAIALGLGLLWGSLVIDLIGYVARSSEGSRLAEISALTAGDGFGFVLLALAKDVLIFAAPSLFIGYLIVRLFATRPMFHAVMAGAPMFLFGAFSLGAALVSGDAAGARGVQAVYMAMNTVLVLLAIPISVAVIQYSTRFIPGLVPRAD